MKKITGVFVGVLALLLISGFVFAKNGKGEAEEESYGKVVVLNKADFLTKVFDYEKNADQWVYAGDKPCIVDFYADWCGPCRKLAPTLRELADKYKDDIVIYKVNVDNEKDLARFFGVRSVPTLLFIPKDEEPKMAMGALPRETFVEQINTFLLKK